MSQAILEKNIIDVLGLESLPDEERFVFLAQIADAVMESTLLRLVAGLNEDQQESLEHYLSTDPKPEVMMEHFATHYKAFETIFQEEVIAFKEEAVALLGESTNT
jgi:hypothetical protein